MNQTQNDLLDDLLHQAKTAGADAADAMVLATETTSVSTRGGELENTNRADSTHVSLRVFAGQRQASVSATELTQETLGMLVDRAVATARLAPEDPAAGIADARELDVPGDYDLDIFDDGRFSAELLFGAAKAMESAGLNVDGIGKSSGAGAGATVKSFQMAASNGFSGGYRQSTYYLYCSMIAGREQNMEQCSDHAIASHFEDLPNAEEIGRTVAREAVRRIGGDKMATGEYPIVFAPKVANSLISHFANAVNGNSVVTGASFLKDALDTGVFAAGVEIVDDPHRLRGTGSAPFDAEGIVARKVKLVDNGVLKTWLLDLVTARRLNLKTNGRAARMGGGMPSPAPTNLYMSAGKISVGDLMGDIASGLYVTDLSGQGVNAVTGGYSRGASGFLIENGELTRPVREVTIAGNLKDMFRQLTPADDLIFRYNMNSPTVRIEKMMVAGS